MLKETLLEELNRYKSINNYNYGKTTISEQTAPGLGDEAGAPPPADAAAPAATDPTAAPAPVDPTAAPTDPTAAPAPDAAAPPVEEDSEQIDITDLVNMTKSIKKDLEDSKTDNSGTIQKMDDVFTKLNDLEVKLSEMNALVHKIDELGMKIDQMKPETPVEKLEMRSLDSYPFNEKPNEFFAHKQDEMRKTGKNEYVLTKDDVNSYSNDQIKQTFNPSQEENEYKF
jgi:hypothetical protein